MQNFGSLKLVTAPTASVISTDDAKIYLRVDDTGEDDLIDQMVLSATDLVEQYVDKKLITQTWDYFLDYFPTRYARGMWWDGVRDLPITELYGQSGQIDIPLGKLSSVSFLKTFDNDDAEYIMDGSTYYADISSQTGRIALRLGQVWPATVLRQANGIQIRFVVGYGSSSSAVPPALIMAVKETLAAMYENRGDAIVKLPSTAMNFANPYKKMRA